MTTSGAIFRFWFPLATTWMMMAAEGPIVAAVIARMPDATLNLAAFGVASAFSSLIEAPILMLLAAATALAKDEASYRSLRRFAFGLNAMLTALMFVVIAPPVFWHVSRRWLELPEEVGELAYGAVVCLLPWPGSIGYRRFHQGLLVRANMTRWVAYGTICRLVGILGTALLLPRLIAIPGAFVGGAALSMGVLVEAVVAGQLAKRAIRDLHARASVEGPGDPIPLGEIVRFYLPLATTSILPMAVQPMLTFFMGHSRLPIASLAVFPVVSNFVFVFRCTGVSFQEVTIALLARHPDNIGPLVRFARRLGFVTSGLLVATCSTGLSRLWFGTVTGLPDALTDLAVSTTLVLMILPAFTVAQALQRGRLVARGLTAPISWATMVEVTVISSVMTVGIVGLGAIGAHAAAAAVLSGQLAANTFLMLLVRRYPERPRTLVAA
ncbi:MAG: hypothetical protein U0Q12_19705 [Vicinamibacterales bacterium]